MDKKKEKKSGEEVSKIYADHDCFSTDESTDGRASENSAERNSIAQSSDANISSVEQSPMPEDVGTSISHDNIDSHNSYVHEVTGEEGEENTITVKAEVGSDSEETGPSEQLSRPYVVLSENTEITNAVVTPLVTSRSTSESVDVKIEVKEEIPFEDAIGNNNYLEQSSSSAESNVGLMHDDQNVPNPNDVREANAGQLETPAIDDSDKPLRPKQYLLLGHQHTFDIDQCCRYLDEMERENAQSQNDESARTTAPTQVRSTSGQMSYSQANRPETTVTNAVASPLVTSRLISDNSMVNRDETAIEQTVENNLGGSSSILQREFVDGASPHLNFPNPDNVRTRNAGQPESPIVDNSVRPLSPLRYRLFGRQHVFDLNALYDMIDETGALIVRNQGDQEDDQR